LHSNYTLFTCKTPLFSSSASVTVEVLNEEGVFSSSLNNALEVKDTLELHSVDVFKYPLDHTRPLFTLTGTNFDSTYTYYCEFSLRGLSFSNQTTATRISSTQLTCYLPANSTAFVPFEQHA